MSVSALKLPLRHNAVVHVVPPSKGNGTDATGTDSVPTRGISKLPNTMRSNVCSFPYKTFRRRCQNENAALKLH